MHNKRPRLLQTITELLSAREIETNWAKLQRSRLDMTNFGLRILRHQRRTLYLLILFASGLVSHLIR